MDGAGHKILARSTFAADQNGGIGASHTRDEAVNLAHRFTFAHHVVFDSNLVLQSFVFSAEALYTEQIADGRAGERGDGGDKIEMPLVEDVASSFQTEDAFDPFEAHQRRSQQATRAHL